MMRYHFAVSLDKKGKILAYSTSETLVADFIEGLSKSKKKETIIETILLNKNEIKEINERYGKKEIVVSDLLGDTITPDNEELYSTMQEEHDKLRFIIKDLESIIVNYSLHKEDRKILKEANALLKKLSKKKNFYKATGFDTIREIEDDGKLNLLKKIFHLGGRS